MRNAPRTRNLQKRRGIRCDAQILPHTSPLIRQFHRACQSSDEERAAFRRQEEEDHALYEALRSNWHKERKAMLVLFPRTKLLQNAKR